MNVRRAVVGFLLVTVAYLAALAWADSRNQVFSALPRLVSALPLLAAMSLLSYVVRYARWRWLLTRAGFRTAVVPGFLAYLAGFAFTATPGKVGELLRIRYLVPRGVPADRVVAAFVYERAFDLVVVLFLASLSILRSSVFLLALAFVFAFVAIVVLIATHPDWLDRSSARFKLDERGAPARFVGTLRDGLALCRTWATLADASVAVVTGIVAWSITSASFVWLLGALDVPLATRPAFGIYPTAMLAGAASMLPGGIGSTEAAIVALLAVAGVPLALATLAAVGIRLASLWFAIVCGFIAVATLEWAAASTGRRRPAI